MCAGVSESMAAGVSFDLFARSGHVHVYWPFESNTNFEIIPQTAMRGSNIHGLVLI